MKFVQKNKNIIFSNCRGVLHTPTFTGHMQYAPTVVFLFLLIFIFTVNTVNAQNVPIDRHTALDAVSPENNEEIAEQARNDNNGANGLPRYTRNDEENDTPVFEKTVIKNPSGVDTVITFFAEDTMIVNLKTKIAILKGNATVEMQRQKLSAAIIKIDFNTSTLTANLVRDSAGTPIGIPVMNDNGEEFFGEELIYNMKDGTGTIRHAETKMGEGFYFGTKIKRVSRNEMFIKDGYYTTCDAPYPHYHFGSKKMKMRVHEKLFVDNLWLYVEDIPIVPIPFSLFLPMQSGRRSGLIVPSFYFSNSRGVVFQNLGFYWAASDFWDTKFTTDIYSKGGFILNNSTQWKLKNIFDGNSNISFGNTRFSLDDNFAKEYRLKLSHNHTFTPFENANLNLNFASRDFNRNTSTNLEQRVEQSIRSSAAYSRTFENGVNSSLSFQNEQNIITGEYTGGAPLSVSIPQKRFMRNLFNIPANSWYSWMRDMTFNYRGNANYNFFKKQQAINRYETDAGIIYDTVFNTDATGFISHSPSISITPKFGHFNVTPSINFGANNYFRKIIKTWDEADSTVLEEFQRGFFTEYFYSYGVGVSTRLYGIADQRRKFLGVIDPNLIGITAFRHTYQPTVNFSYTPDFSTDRHNFYGRYFDTKQEREVKYSFFEREGGSHASSMLQKRISYSDMHSFEIKRKGKDTLPDVNMELLRLTFNLSHNFAADSLKFSDISSTFRTPALKFLDLSGNAAFTLYDEKMTTHLQNNRLVRVNEFLLSNGKGLARLTNAGINISTSFSSSGFIDQSNVQTLSEDSVTVEEVSQELGGRFLMRDQSSRKDGDIFGEFSDGYSRFSMPWSVNFGLSFNYRCPSIARIDRNLNLNTTFNFTLVESWIVSTTFQYDFINKQFITPQLNLTKDLHCWELQASWYPIGYNAGFYLRFGIKSAQLRDMKIEKRDSPVFR